MLSIALEITTFQQTPPCSAHHGALFPLPLREGVTLQRKKERRYLVLAQPSWFFFPFLNEF